MCALVVTLRKLQSFSNHAASQTKPLCDAALVPDWPHVIDLWCAGLVTTVAEHNRFVFWRGFCSMVFTLLVGSSEFVQGFLSSRPCCSRRPSHHLGVGQVSRWWYVLISLSLLHRGEAINPGPPVGAKIRSGKLKTWSMGTFNPSGLGGKHQVISSYLNDCNLWAVTETHLTSQGMRSFRQGLKWSDSKFDYCIGGQPVPLRSHSCATGHWNGVAIISKSPNPGCPHPVGS